MATRTISTKLAIEGESEYRSTLSRINTELKTLQSNLKLTESQYQTSANTVDALKAKHDALASVIDAQKKKVDELKKALENAKNAQDIYAQNCANLREKIQANEQAMEKLKNSSGDTSKEQKALAEETDKLKKALEEEEAKLTAAEKGVNNWQTQLNNAQVDLNNLDAELQKNDKYLDEAKDSADGCAHSIDEFGNEVKDSSNAVDALAQALAAAGLAKTAQEIASALKDCIDSSIRFESAMTGVAKTTDLSGRELDDMAGAIKTLTTQIPITATEFAGIAEAAGQLGITKGSLLDFSTVMANLGVATNLTAEEAAVMLAQFANVTNMDQGDFERLGSVVVGLGNNFATDERQIVEMSQRLASAGTIAGLTEPEIMALSTAMASVGIKAEAGGTAMAQTLSKIETAVASGSDSLDLYAQVAGMSAGEFVNAWKNEPIVALQAFIEGLGRLDEEGESVTQVLEELDLKGIRQTNMLKALGIASGLLADTVDTANTAWAENVALTNEAEKRYATTESKITLYKNSVENLKIAIGDQLTPALGNLAEKGTNVVTWAEKMVQENEWLAPAITAVATSMGTFLVTLTGATTVIPLVKTAFTALHDALIANPYAIVASAIAAVITALATLALTMPEVENEYRTLTSTSKDQYDKIQQLNSEYERACELYGKDSEEARKLAAQIEAETDIFNRNKTTIEDVTQKTNDLIDSSQRLRSESAEATEEINRSYESTSYLIGRLQELMGEEEKTAGTKQQILATVDALNQQIPNLGLAYDSYSDKLNITTEKLIELAKAEAEQQKAAADYQHLIELEIKQSEISAQLIKVQEEREAAERRLTDAKTALADVEDKYGDLQAGTIGQMITYAEKTGAYTTAVIDAQTAVNQFTEDEQRLSEEYEKCSEEIQGLAGAHAELAESAENAVSAEQSAADAITGKLNELAEGYAAAYESARQSIEGQFSLWEVAPSVTAKSVGEMLEALNSQADWWQWYSDYVEELRARDVEGVDEFLAKVADGSTESAAILLGLSTASDEEFAKVVAAMNRVGDNESKVTGDLALLRTNLTGELGLLAQEFENTVNTINHTTGEVDFGPFNDAVKTAFENVGAKFETIGSDTGLGLQNGITMSSGQVYGAANDMAQGIVDAVMTVLDEHSPSRVMHEIGENVNLGLAEGIDAESETVTDTAAELGEHVVGIMTEAGKGAVDGFNSEFLVLKEKVNEHLSEAKAAVEEATAGLSQTMEYAGVQMVNGMIDGIYSQSGALYSAVSSVVNEAIATAQNEAGVHSPSWKTEEIFEDVGEGMIVGVEKKKKDVAAATKGVVYEALRIDESSLRTASELLTMHAPDMSSLIAPSAVATSAQPVGNIEVNIDMTGTVIREEADIRKISNELAWEMRAALRQKGVL